MMAFFRRAIKVCLLFPTTSGPAASIPLATFQYYSINPDEMEAELHAYAKELLDAGNINEAWQVLLANS